MIWTLAWNTMQAEWNMRGYWGRYEGRGDPTSMRHKARGYFEWQHVSFLNRQTWLLIIIHARRLRRLLSLDSTAEIQQLGFWNLWTHFRRWKYFRDRHFASLITMGVSKRGFILRRAEAKGARFSSPMTAEGLLSTCLNDFVYLALGMLDLWYFLSLSALNFLTNAGLL